MNFFLPEKSIDYFYHNIYDRSVGGEVCDKANDTKLVETVQD